MATFRVRYARRTYVELYLEVEAVSEESAKAVAATRLEDGDDDLVEDTPLSKFSQETTPTGEVEKIDDLEEG